MWEYIKKHIFKTLWTKLIGRSCSIKKIYINGGKIWFKGDNRYWYIRFCKKIDYVNFKCVLINQTLVK